MFLGVTRDNFNGRPVTQLSYECYDKMALKSMELICDEMIQKYELQAIAILHRVGLVPVKEASVIIVGVSAHRRAAIDAVSEGIDLLKERVPIWKKEFYDECDHSTAWKRNPEFTQLLD